MKTGLRMDRTHAPSGQPQTFLSPSFPSSLPLSLPPSLPHQILSKCHGIIRMVLRQPFQRFSRQNCRFSPALCHRLGVKALIAEEGLRLQGREGTKEGGKEGGREGGREGAWTNGRSYVRRPSEGEGGSNKRQARRPLPGGDQVGRAHRSSPPPEVIPRALPDNTPLPLSSPAYGEHVHDESVTLQNSKFEPSLPRGGARRRARPRSWFRPRPHRPGSWRYPPVL